MAEAGPDNALLAAIQIAATDASARIQAALGAASTQATAEVSVANIRQATDENVAQTEADARRDVAQITGQYQVQAVQAENQWHTDVARIEADAQTTSATTAADAEKAAAQSHAQATVSAANAAASAQTASASTDAAAREVVASTEAGATVGAAQAHANAVLGAATAQASATTTAAATQANATVSAATIDAGWHANVATIGANATIQAATIDAGWHAGVASTELVGVEYKADKDLAGVSLHESSETARLNLKLAFANDKWNTLLPIIDDALGIAAQGIQTITHTGGGAGFHASARPGPVMGFGSVIASAADDFQVGSYSRRAMSNSEIRMGSGDVKTGGIGFASGGSLPDAVAATQLPFISTSGVLTPAQIQQQVNAAYARNDAKANSESLRLVEEMTGRGFSANSPILGALRVGITGQNLRSSIQAETQIRFDSAKLNADAVFDAQKAVSDQFIAQEQVLVDSAKNDVTRIVGILNAVSQLIGSAL